MEFQVKKVTADLVEWIRQWFDRNGPGCKAVLGISGGKDSTVCAALCAAALGKDRVVGVLMPNGVQDDIADSYQLVAHLGIPHYTIPIGDSVAAVRRELAAAGIPESDQSRINLPPRIRMSVLYAVSQSVNGRVINTCNLSEDWVGYSTRYGDSAGDVSLLGRLTVQEVKAIGRELGLPANLVDKAPSDGLSGSTDEVKLGFTYAALDRYICDGLCEDETTKNRIDTLHVRNLFKLELMPVFDPGIERALKMKEEA